MDELLLRRKPVLRSFCIDIDGNETLKPLPRHFNGDATRRLRAGLMSPPSGEIRKTPGIHPLHLRLSYAIL